ncbi:MAG: type II toxin-antitoxin system PemK/MazF family toxin [Aquirhabdus sp.]
MALTSNVVEPLYKRGDIVTIAVQGDFRVRRPAMILQSNLFSMHPSVVILPITDELLDAPLFRIPVEKSETNGLLQSSQIMVDKPQTLLKDKVGEVVGQLDSDHLQAVDRALLIFLGFA